jgi:hypothetical protein
LHEKHANSIRAYEAEKGTNVSTPKTKTATNTSDQGKDNQPSISNKESYKARKEREKQERKDQNRFKKLEGIIAQKENDLKALDEQITAVGTEDRTKMTELSYQYETVQNDLNAAMEEWTLLGEKLI